MKIYKAILDLEEFYEPVIIGYFTTKKKAWEACFKEHHLYKDSRIQIFYKCRETLDDSFIRDGFGYNWHYKYYYLEEIDVEE